MVCSTLYHKITLIHHVGCIENALRLVGGETELEGTVEVCIHSVWGLIGDGGWNEADADVVCRQLGLPTGGIYHTPGTCIICLCRCHCSYRL